MYLEDETNTWRLSGAKISYGSPLAQLDASSSKFHFRHDTTRTLTYLLEDFLYDFLSAEKVVTARLCGCSDGSDGAQEQH